MKNLIFHEGLPDPAFTFDFEPSLFNLEEHRLLQRQTDWVSFSIQDQQNQKILAAIHFNIEHAVAKSPFKSPFGALEFSEALSAEAIFNFLEYTETRLKSKAVKKIIIKHPPQLLLGSRAAWLHTFYFNLNYQVTNAEIGAVLQVSDHPFADSLHAWEKRRLRQAQEAGLEFRQLSASQAVEVFTLISQCRKEKEYELSMTLDDFKTAISKFPDRYIFFGIFDQNKMVSASIAIRVKSNIVYNFYADHKKEYDQLSPLVMLIGGIYDYCQKHSITLLDLGTSAVEGRPNFGLLDFKMNLGAIPTMKLTFEKDLL